MHQGKHYKRSGRSGKPIALLVSLLLLIGVTVGGTITFLLDTDGAVENQFKPAQVTTAVGESLSGAVKSNAFIQNTGDVSAWIRAAVVITWQDAEGNIYGQAPVLNTDYEIVWGGGWLTGSDGFYYWNAPVAASGSTGSLIASCTSKNTAPDGYYLAVEIVGSGIQSQPASVFNTEWASSGLKVNNVGTALVTQ